MANCFTNNGEPTFIWRIENFTFCLERQFEVVSSPVFNVPIDGNESTWYLLVYPRLDSNNIAYNIYRHSPSKNCKDIGEIHYEVFLIDVNGAPSKSVQGRVGADGKSMIAVRQKLLEKEKNTLLPLDTLTIGCRMWKRKEEPLKATQRFARTRIGVEEKCFIWAIEKFSSLSSSDTKTIVAESHSRRQPSMNLKLFLRDTLFGGKRVQIEIHQSEMKSKNLTICRVTLIDAKGEISESYMDDHWFDPQGKKVWSFPFFISRSKLLDNNSTYLPNDVLSIRFEWIISIGIIYNKLEDVDFGLPQCPPISITSTLNQEIRMGTDSLHSVVKDEQFNTRSLLRKMESIKGNEKFILKLVLMFLVFHHLSLLLYPTLWELIYNLTMFPLKLISNYIKIPEFLVLAVVMALSYYILFVHAVAMALSCFIFCSNCALI